MSDRARIGDFGYSGSAGSSPELDVLRARVAELEKERDEAIHQADQATTRGRDAEVLRLRAEAGLAAAQEALPLIDDALGKYGQSFTATGTQGWTLLDFYRERGGTFEDARLALRNARDALARGGGQQETGK